MTVTMKAGPAPGGLSVDETAEVMKIAPITVMREWNKAKAWLFRELARS